MKQQKYKLKASDETQQLLRVSREISGKNFLLFDRHKAQKPSKKEEGPVYLVPEFCHVHPLPCSIWKQLVWIPAVIHRVTKMLAAEELRLQIHRATNIGVDCLPGQVAVASVWRPMLTRRRTSTSKASFAVEPRLLVHSVEPNNDVVPADTLDSEINLMWQVEYSEADLRQEFPSAMNEDEPASDPASEDNLTSHDPMDCLLPTSWREEAMNFRFDVAATDDLSEYGPSPGMILEALTLKKTGEGFDLERLETIGDSILKLGVTVYAYGRASARQRYDEGRLTAMRIAQINNEHLCKLGKQKGIGSFIAGQKFDIAQNFLPPAFKTPSTGPEMMNQHEQQIVSVKNVADSMEALIGVYLLTCGIKGALKCMDWMGLKTVPSEAEHFNELNGFPLLPASPIPPAQNTEEELKQLYIGLESFEQKINYTFKNKALLIEAFTHASCSRNQLTGCYQRLEFLGDAVLGRLI